MADEDKKLIVKLGYETYAKRQLGYRLLDDDFKHLTSLTDRLEKNARILDLGCGNGLPIDKYLVEKGFKVIGIDLSEEQIRQAKINIPSAEFKVMDMDNLDFENKSYEAVISFHSIYHLPRSGHEKLIKKIYDILVEGGYLMITMGTTDWEGTDIIVEDIIMYWSNFGRQTNVDIVRKVGFDVLYEEIYSSAGREHLIIFAKKR